MKTILGLIPDDLSEKLKVHCAKTKKTQANILIEGIEKILEEEENEDK